MFGCGEEEIRVPVGRLGELGLVVCSNCKFKFVHNDYYNQGKTSVRKIANSRSVCRRDQSLADKITPPFVRNEVNG